MNYKYRMHDARIGRFFAVDPLEASYPHNSPYAFSENVVIHAVELEGLEKVELSEPVFDGDLNNGDDTHEDGQPRGGYQKWECGQVWQCGDVNEDGMVTSTGSWVSVGEWESSDGIQLIPLAGHEENSAYFREQSGKGNGMEAGLVMAIRGKNPLALLAGSMIIVGTTGLVVINTPNLDIVGSFPYARAMTIDPPFTIPLDYATDDGVNTRVMDDGFITVFRGVPKYIKNGSVVENPAYKPALAGTAVPQGGDAGPFEANMGVPSNFTFWSTNPFVAYSFATRKGTSSGVMLTMRVPWGTVMPNSSPDKFQEGEIQMLGTQTGAVPLQVGSN